MKKLFLYIFLSLFLLIGCSENKEDKALENCATSTISLSKNDHLWENEREFTSIDIKLDETKTQIAALQFEAESIKTSEEKAKNKFLKENLEPYKPPKYKFADSMTKQEEADWIDASNIHQAWQTKFDDFKDNLKNKFNFEKVQNSEQFKLKNSQKSELEVEIANIIRKIARKKMDSMNLDKKRKLEGFIESYYLC